MSATCTARRVVLNVPSAVPALPFWSVAVDAEEERGGRGQAGQHHVVRRAQRAGLGNDAERRSCPPPSRPRPARAPARRPPRAATRCPRKVARRGQHHGRRRRRRRRAGVGRQRVAAQRRLRPSSSRRRRCRVAGVRAREASRPSSRPSSSRSRPRRTPVPGRHAGEGQVRRRPPPRRRAAPRARPTAHVELVAPAPSQRVDAECRPSGSSEPSARSMRRLADEVHVARRRTRLRLGQVQPRRQPAPLPRRGAAALRPPT